MCCCGTMMCVCLVSFAMSVVNAATRDNDEALLLNALQLPYLRLASVVDSNASSYLRHLSEARQRKVTAHHRYTSTTIDIFVYGTTMQCG